MKRTGKFLIALLAVVILLTSMTALTASAATGQPEKLYLTPSANWKQDNARYAAYFFGNGETWVSMTYNSKLGVYEVTVPTAKTYPNVIFCRMNPSASANNWNNKWNQTADLTIPTSGANHYTVKEGTWDKGGGAWSTLGSTCSHTNLGPAATCTTAQVCLDCKDPIVSALGHNYNTNHLCTRCNTQATFTVAGSGKHLGIEWDTGNTANDMTYADGVYTKVYENVAAGSYKLKVARDHDWGTAYPSSDYVYTVKTAGSTVTVTLKGTTVKVTVEAPPCLHDSLQNNAAACTTAQECDGCGESVVLGHNYNTNHLCIRCNTQATFTVAGSGAHLGTTEWDVTNTANDMTYADGVYTKVYEKVAAGSYKLKVARDHDWGTAYPSDDYVYTVSVEGSTVTVTLTGTTVDVKVEAPENPGVQTDIYTIAGSSVNLLGAIWDEANAANDMKLDETTGLWTISYTNNGSTAINLEYKVVKNHSWDKCWGGAAAGISNSDNAYINVPAGATLTITFDATAEKITTSVVEVEPDTPDHEHAYVEGKCSVCGDIDPNYVEGYYLVGWINGADYGCNEDWENLGNYRFDDGKLTVKFNQDSYVFVKSLNLKGEFGWFLSDTYQEDKDATLIRDKSEKLWLPGNTEITLTLTVNEDGTLTLVADYHTHSHTKVVTDPTCTEAGYTTYTCECGDTYTADNVDALGHDIVVDKAVDATCTETGLTAGEHCTRCDHKVEQEVVDALGHDMVVDKAVDATCTATGLTEGSHCSRCDHKVAQEEVPALGHDIVVDEAVAPSCTETGLKAGEHCTRCDHKVEQEVVDALGHDIVVDEAVAPSCTETGLTAGEHCTRCDHKVEQEVVDALGHNMVVDKAVDATCTETGLTEGSHCTRCDYKVAQEEVPALNHKAADERVKENEVAPTCEGKGSYDLVLYCSRCGEELDREAVEVDALGHKAGKPVVENSTAASCGAAGSYDEVVYCTVCGEELSRTTHTVDATPHSYKETITEEPTCTEAGVKTIICSVCGDTYTESIDALGHDKISHEAKAPTCTAIGWEAYETCSRCDYTTYNELPKIKHSYNAVVTAPTCTAAGFTTNTCSVCGTSYISDEVAALGHDMVVDEAVAPSCTETGLTEGSHCSRCDHKVAQEEVPALGHDMVADEAVAPSCTETGLTAGEHCTRCDHKVAQEEVPALGHDIVVDEAVAPSCTETGLTAGEHCTRCDHKVAQEVVDALGHDIVVDEAVAPSCTETGLTAGEHCTRCDHKVAQEVVDALGHDIVVDEAVAPSCTETGLTAGEHCTRCDHVVAQEEVPALGHDIVADAAVAPSCTETGLTEGSHCSRCDYKVAQEEVPATGHTYENGKCHCGAEDPDYVEPEQPGEEKPEPKPEPQPEQPGFFQRIWKAIVDFFKSIIGKITSILPKK